MLTTIIILLALITLTAIHMIIMKLNENFCKALKYFVAIQKGNLP